MRWQSKGHEFDEIGLRLKSLVSIYLFGAGLTGEAVYKKYCGKITIKGFIDNDKAKQNTTFCGLKVFSPGDIEILPDEAIVVTVTPTAYEDVLKQLTQTGCIDREAVFSAYTFLPVLDMYKFGELCLPSISFLPATVCNLRCRCCLNFSPYIRKNEIRAIETLKCDLDLLFSKADTILTFHISGGEPFLYQHLGELIEYIHCKFYSQIGQLEMSTNGTQVPSDSLCEVMREANLHITVDDYRSAVLYQSGQYEKLISKLDSFGIAYHVQRANAWIDLAPFETDNSHLTNEQLGEYFTACAVPWQEYRDGKMWLCNYAAYADIAEIQEASVNDAFELSRISGNNKMELLEFRLGYSDKGYTEFCRRCRGYGNNHTEVPPAEQL